MQPKDFLFSRTLYAVTSIEASNQVWLEQLKGKDQVVRDFAARKKNLYPTQQFLDHGDTFDALVKYFESSKEARARLIEQGIIPTKKGEVGVVYPIMDELFDILKHVKGAAAAKAEHVHGSSTHPHHTPSQWEPCARTVSSGPPWRGRSRSGRLAGKERSARCGAASDGRGGRATSRRSGTPLHK